MAVTASSMSSAISSKDCQANRASSGRYGGAEPVRCCGGAFQEAPFAAWTAHLNGSGPKSAHAATELAKARRRLKRHEHSPAVQRLDEALHALDGTG